MPQSLAQVHVHIVFSTKGRTRFLDDEAIRRQTHAYLAATLNEHECPALLVGGTADHVHVVCTLSRTRSLAEVIGKVKHSSSKWIKTKGPRLVKFAWQNGYGAFSVSHSNLARMRAYVRDQSRHHRRMTFQDEVRVLLEKHGVAYDERYVWD